MEKFAPLVKGAYENDSEEEGGLKSTDEENEDDIEQEEDVKKITPSLKVATDEFDKEMDNALKAVFLQCDELGNAVPSSPAATTSYQRKLAEDEETELGLREEYSLSDEEFMEENKMDKCAADRLFYNPADDEENQRWIDDHRRSYQPTASSGRPLPKSDAILNCPSCMTQLCLDCQQHVKYPSQFRAMFVENCQVKFDESLTVPLERRKKPKRLPEGLEPPDINDRFHPVVCELCGTEVAVYDKEEVYHFFNVLSSYC